MFVGASEIEKKIVGNLCQLSVQNGAKPGGVFFKEMSNLARGTIKIIIWNKVCIYNTFPAQLANLIHFTYCWDLDLFKYQPTWQIQKTKVFLLMYTQNFNSFI